MNKRAGHWVKIVLSMVVAAVSLGGCGKSTEPVDYNKPLPPGAHALRKITDPDMMPDFAAGFPSNRQDLLKATDHSISWFRDYPSSRQFYPLHEFTHEHSAQSLEHFRQVVIAAQSPQALQARILQDFDVYQSVGCDMKGTVLFTGYYHPIYPASLEPVGQFQHPLYRMPPDLVKGPDGAILGRRLPNGSIVKFPPRQQLESSGMLRGLELVYVRSRFEAFVIHVQGGATLQLQDGRMMEIGYAASNGHDYRSVRELLVEDGKIDPYKASLGAMKAYFDENPGELDRYISRNPRFIFFTETHGGPFGSLGQPVTPLRSLATDKTIFPRGNLTFVTTHLFQPIGPGQARNDPFNQFMLDQDTGGAIRAPGRADIFIGTGHAAGQIAGRTAMEGKLYYLFLKPELVGAVSARNQGDKTDAAGAARPAYPDVPAARYAPDAGR